MNTKHPNQSSNNSNNALTNTNNNVGTHSSTNGRSPANEWYRRQPPILRGRPGQPFSGSATLGRKSIRWMFDETNLLHPPLPLHSTNSISAETLTSGSFQHASGGPSSFLPRFQFGGSQMMKCTSSTNVAAVTGNGNYLEYIKTRPTIALKSSTLDGRTINWVSAMNSGSSMNICSPFVDDTSSAFNARGVDAEMNPDSTREYRVIGNTGDHQNFEHTGDYRIVENTGHSGSLVVVKKGGSLPRLKFADGNPERSESEELFGNFSKIFGRNRSRPAVSTIFKTVKKPRPQQPLPAHATPSSEPHPRQTAPPAGGTGTSGTRPFTEGGAENPHPDQDSSAMPSIRTVSSAGPPPGSSHLGGHLGSIPPEGTLAGLLPPSSTAHSYHPHNMPPQHQANLHNGNIHNHHHPHQQIHPPPPSQHHASVGIVDPSSSSSTSPYVSLPMKNVRNAMTNGVNSNGNIGIPVSNGNIGIPVSNGNGAPHLTHNPHLLGSFAREAWNRNSQGPQHVLENPSITGHPHNGHIPNGHLQQKGPHPQENSHHLPPSNGLSNGYHPHMGHQNLAYQHTPETTTVNGLNAYNANNSHINGGSTQQLNGQYHHMNGQHNHGTGEIIHLNGLAKISPNSRLETSNGQQGGGGLSNGNGMHHPNGPVPHSPLSTSSIAPHEANSANERHEEQRNDDRWGSLKKGLKYNHLKGIIAGKFGGKNDSKGEKRGTSPSKVLSSQGTNTQISKLPSRDNSPSKREKNTNLGFQNSHLTNGNHMGQNPNFPASAIIETNLSTPSGMQESPSKQTLPQPPNGFAHGAPFRSSVVHFDLPSSASITQQRGGSTRVLSSSGSNSGPVAANDSLANKRSGSYQQLTHQQQHQQPQQQQPQVPPKSQQQIWRQQQQQQQQQQHHHFSADNLADALPSDHTYGTNGRTLGVGVSSSGCAEASSTSDSGRGTVGSGGGGSGVGERRSGHNTSLDSGASTNRQLGGHSSGNDSEWVDITDGDIHKLPGNNNNKQTPHHPGYRNPTTYGSRRDNPSLHPKHPGVGGGGIGGPQGPSTHGPSNAPVMGTANLGANRGSGANTSRRSLVRRESLAATPPLPPLSPEGSPRNSPASSPARNGNQYQRSYSSSALNQPDLLEDADGSRITRPGNSKGGMNQLLGVGGGQRWRQQDKHFSERAKDRMNLPPLLCRHSTGRLDIDPSELTEDSTDALDLESCGLDGDETDASTYCGGPGGGGHGGDHPDVNLIRKQLEGLEGMYSEVLQLLGGNGGPNKLKQSRRRLHGSMSSLPSSVMSATKPRDRRRAGTGVVEDRLRRHPAGRDAGKGVQRRFQRLESHVVTLARSVAHLSSEMRSQHTLLQEMESIRQDVAALRSSTSCVPLNHIANNPVHNGALHAGNLFKTGGPGLNNPSRVKKLTQFFGDELPLVRMFLRKLGYEKYAGIFEQEKIGMLELPYLNEDRLQKLGIPLGPRLRILQEAQGPITTDGNLSVYVV